MYAKRNRYGPISVEDGPSSLVESSTSFGPFGSTSVGDIEHDPIAVESAPKERAKSLDAFRGLVILTMIFVDNAGTTYGGHINHSPWNDITFADFVMPYFLFIVGLSMVLANQSLNKDGLRTTLFWNTVKRCIRLFILGLLVQGTNQFGTAYDFSSLRICGILQRIAFCQLVVAVIELTVPVRDIGYQDTGYFRLYGKFAWHWFVTFLILMVYTIIMYTTPVPGCPHAGLSTPQCNAAGYWDTQILGLSHMYTHPTYHRLPECSSCSPRYCPIPNRPEWCELPFDPEGAIASICAIGSVFIGAFVGHIFIDTKQSQAERMRQMGPLAIVLTLIGVVMHFAGIPFNKNLYSLSYMFFMGGTSIGCLMLFCLLIDIMKFEKPFWPFIWMGLNAIAIFVGNDIGDAVLGWFYYQKPENNIASLVRDKLFVEYMGYDGGLMAFTWLKMIFWVAVSGLLVRLKIFIKI